MSMAAGNIGSTQSMENVFGYTLTAAVDSCSDRHDFWQHPDQF